MNAYEYRKTLTDRQANAFGAMLENALRSANWYQKNCETHDKVMKVYYDGLERHKTELEAIELEFDEFNKRQREIQDRLHDEWKEAIAKKEAAMEAVKAKAWEEDKEKREAIQAERGDATGERELIEQIIIAQYQARLEKKASKASA